MIDIGELSPVRLHLVSIILRAEELEGKRVPGSTNLKSWKLRWFCVARYGHVPRARTVAGAVVEPPEGAAIGERIMGGDF
jgi:hypothetical protein